MTYTGAPEARSEFRDCMNVDWNVRIPWTTASRWSPLSDFAKTFHHAGRGAGPYAQDDADDRPGDIFGRPVTLCPSGHDSHVLLPVIPRPEA